MPKKMPGKFQPQWFPDDTLGVTFDKGSLFLQTKEEFCKQHASLYLYFLSAALPPEIRDNLTEVDEHKPTNVGFMWWRGNHKEGLNVTANEVYNFPGQLIYGPAWMHLEYHDDIIPVPNVEYAENVLQMMREFKAQNPSKED